MAIMAAGVTPETLEAAPIVGGGYVLKVKKYKKL